MIDYKHLSRHNKPVLDDDNSPTAWQEACFFLCCGLCLLPFVYSLCVVLGVIRG